MKPTPPQIPGLPLIGNTLEFIKDRHGLLQGGFEAFGPIFTIKLLNRKAVVLIGPEYQEMFFTAIVAYSYWLHQKSELVLLYITIISLVDFFFFGLLWLRYGLQRGQVTKEARVPLSRS